mgnify:CR=1 FL=1
MAKHRHELAFLTLAVYHHPVLRVLFALLWVGSLASCGSATVEPKVEHEARLLSPIPACAAVLPSPAPGVQVALRKEYWTIVFPAFDAAQGRLPPMRWLVLVQRYCKTEPFRKVVLSIG